MREIKFRAWNKEEKIMVDLQKITPLALNDMMNTQLNLQGRSGLFIPFFKELELMQYTGLKDKNGKDIYEGDIIRGYDHKTSSNGGFVDDVIGVVKYEGLSFSIQGKQIKNKEKWFYTMTSPREQDEHIEVIGNIYANAKLLKAKK